MDQNTEMRVNRSGFIFDNPGSKTLDQSYQTETRPLGQGTYGTVSKGTDKTTGAVRAIKTMPKKDIKNEARFKAEISIMKQLDHPNIIKLYETFEDKQNTYLVLELCTGGELFDRIIATGFFSEKQAAMLMKQVFMAMNYLHQNHIMHRDLKPENFLFANKSPDSPLKVIDFGLAATFKEGDRMKTKAGTPYYVAPEVLKGNYNQMCDMWSCGVIMYIMLSAYPPFFGDNDNQILKLVKQGTYDYPEEDWGLISKEAKELIDRCLTMDETKRITANQAIEHAWLAKAPSCDAPLSGKFMTNFKTFKHHNQLKKIALTVMAQQLPETEIQTLKETFLALDKNCDGTLTLEEIRQGAVGLGLKLPGELEEWFQGVDSNQSGGIDYTEFIAAMVDKRVYMKTQFVWETFRILDQDKDGKISLDELTSVLGHEAKGTETGSLAESLLPGIRCAAQNLIKQADTDGDGFIDFEEFLKMMQEG